MALYLQIAGSSSHTPLTLTAQLTSLKIGKVDGWMEEEGGGCRLPWPCCCNHQRDGAELGCVLAGDTPQLAAGNWPAAARWSPAHCSCRAAVLGSSCCTGERLPSWPASPRPAASQGKGWPQKWGGIASISCFYCLLHFYRIVLAIKSVFLRGK